MHLINLKDRLVLRSNFYDQNTQRSGRVVDRAGLENRRTERYRGFESLLLCSKALLPLVRVLFYYEAPT